MREFKVNEYITLKLENNETRIYIGNEFYDKNNLDFNRLCESFKYWYENDYEVNFFTKNVKGTDVKLI